MKISDVRFLTSSPSVDMCPDTAMHEYAFIGRSNVGKSSLINMLTGRSELAKTSSTPGKTMLINHFVVNNEWGIVDLPGYGYAQRSQASRAKILEMVCNYILARRQLINLFLLIDSRHEPQNVDLDFMNWLGENGVPFSIVFTKMDKMSATKSEKVIGAYLRSLLDKWEELPPVFRTSSVDGRGRDNILDYIDSLNKLPLD